MVDPLTLSGAAWGISIAGWIISPVMTKLVNKALSYIKPGKSKDKLHELLTHTLPRLALTLEAAEGSPYMTLFEKLVGDLKSAFYDLEDMLDNVEYVLHEKQLAGQKTGKWMIFASRHDVGPSDQGVNISPNMIISQSLNSMLNKNMNKIKELICQAQETIQQANLPCHSVSRQNRPNVTAAYTQKPTTADPVEKVTGRDGDRLRIIKMLRDIEGEEANAISSGRKCFSVIGICGLPGSGKTTLAQYVCQSERTAGYFNLVIWIHVSQNFSVETIYREMFEVASNKHRPSSKSLDGLKKELEEKLYGKRFLLVLDDIWSDNDVADQQLPLLLSPFKVGRRGSKVLVTSRNADAVSDLGRNPYITIPIQDLDDKVFFEVLMYYALGDSRVDDIDQKELHIIGAEIAHKLRRSPLAARTVGGQLRRRQNVEFWRRVRDSDLLKETMGALVLSYNYLDGHLKRCFAYCSIFPRRHRLERDKLVKMWAAEGFVSRTNAEHTEDVCQEFFDELVSASFLQFREEPYEPKFYIVHDLLHDLAEKVAGSDCFRIENGWTGEVPRDVRHLFVEAATGWAIIDKIVELEKLRTLIIIAGQNNNEIITEETIKKVFTKLRKLRVLDIRSEMDTSYSMSFPDSFGNLKHLRYLSFLYHRGLAALTLPGTIAKLYHLQVLCFSGCRNLVLSSKEDMTNLTNLRILRPVPVIPNIGRMTCLQELPLFRVVKEQGYELQQLKNLNKLEGTLVLEGLELVESKEKALEAKLSDKERLRAVVMAWGNNSPEVQADVLAGLCPPRFLKFLEIRDYQGLRAPDWTVGDMKGENYLQSLWLNRCSRLGPALELVEYFVHLREFILTEYDWDTLPNNIEHLKSLVVLRIQSCLKIQSLPVLPQSLKRIEFWDCDEVFMRSCETSSHPNWHKIKHVRSVGIEGREIRTGTIETKSLHWKRYLLDDDSGKGRRWLPVIPKPSHLLYICILMCFISWLWLRHERTLKMSWMDAPDA